MSDSIQSASDSELLEIANTFLVAVSADPTAVMSPTATDIKAWGRVSEANGTLGTRVK